MMNVVDALQAAGLGGRSGGGFSTATKVAAAQRLRADLVVNVCDGELDAAKDAWVVEHHLGEVLRGVELVAGAGVTVWFAAHRGSTTAHRLHDAGLRVLETPPRYVSSEESALVSLARGGLARPMTKRQPFVFGGVDSGGRRIPPTVVLNAETLWRVAQIAEHGPAWFRSFGTADEPGPRLVTVVGHVERPGVMTSAAGVPLASLLENAGARPADALLFNGFGGAFLSMAEALGTRWSTAELTCFGAGVGPGVIRVVDPARCPVTMVDQLLRQAMGESAGQCGPCMFGLPALSAAWHQLTREPGPVTWSAVQQRISLLPGRGACRYPDGLAGFTRSALRVFGDHLTTCVQGSCAAGPATAGLTGAGLTGEGVVMPSRGEASSRTKLRIDRVACTGHGVCAALLPGAIERDEWGYPILLTPDVDASAAKDAVTLCPARALYREPSAGSPAASAAFTNR